MKSSSTFALLCVLALLLDGSAVTATTIDNVAVQWNSLLQSIICTRGILFNDASGYLSQMHLAQWHALLALKNTDRCSNGATEEAAVAYASRAVLVQYLGFDTNTILDPFLQNQLESLDLSASQKKTAKEIGEVVALRLVQSRVGGDLGKDFVLDAVTDALDESTPAPGIYRYQSTPGAAPSRLFSQLGQTKTYVLPNPVAMRKHFLKKYKPPAVPSKEWDTEYNQLKDIGRADWPGRTPEMDNQASFWFGGPKKGSLCTQDSFWNAAVLALLPAGTSLYDTVELYAKLHVSIHDAIVLGSSMQWAFWFWRPPTAYKTGDPGHAPLPNWNAWLDYNAHPEYPSLTAVITAAGASVVQKYFDRKSMKIKPFTVVGGSLGPVCDTSSPGIGPRHYDSLSAVVKDAQLGRMYAGHHFNVSVTDGAEIGAIVSEYVDMHWTEPGGPSGVLPDAAYLSVFARVPSKAGKSSDITYKV